MALKNGDFIKLDFTGIDEEDDQVFDTTKQDVAKEHGIYEQRINYEPITVCIGEGHVLPGLDEELVGKDEEAAFTVTLKPEQAFGKKKSEHLKLMPKKVFEKQDVNPRPGMEVNIDDMRGTIKNVSGNRIIVDFNHPLAGREITYEIQTHGKVTDLAEQVETITGMTLRHKADVSVEDKTATISFPIDLPEEITTEVTDKITSLTAITDVKFVKPEADKK